MKKRKQQTPPLEPDGSNAPEALRETIMNYIKKTPTIECAKCDRVFHINQTQCAVCDAVLALDKSRTVWRCEQCDVPTWVRCLNCHLWFCENEEAWCCDRCGWSCDDCTIKEDERDAMLN
jgi:hypothetical protein